MPAEELQKVRLKMRIETVQTTIPESLDCRKDRILGQRPEEGYQGEPIQRRAIEYLFDLFQGRRRRLIGGSHGQERPKPRSRCRVGFLLGHLSQSGDHFRVPGESFEAGKNGNLRLLVRRPDIGDQGIQWVRSSHLPLRVFSNQDSGIYP